MTNRKTRFEIFEDWCNGIGLAERTRDHHGLYAIQRFKLFEAEQLRKVNTKQERD